MIVNMRFVTALFSLSLFASDAFAASANIAAANTQCSPEEFHVKGLKATMRIEVPPGGPDTLKEAFRGYASSRDLLFASTWGVDRQPFPPGYPPTVFVTTRLEGVAITIKSGTSTADVEVQTTCRADEEWEPHWQQLQAFVAASNYRV